MAYFVIDYLRQQGSSGSQSGSQSIFPSFLLPSKKEGKAAISPSLVLSRRISLSPSRHLFLQDVTSRPLSFDPTVPSRRCLLNRRKRERAQTTSSSSRPGLPLCCASTGPRRKNIAARPSSRLSAQTLVLSQRMSQAEYK